MVEHALKTEHLAVLYDGELAIKCPLCGHEYSHMRSVHTRWADDESGFPFHPIDGTVGRERDLCWRRDGLVITSDGECEHAWQLIIQQHKGTDRLLYRQIAKSDDGG